MATVSEGKRLDMLGKRQKMELARTGSFTTRTGDQYTPNYIDLAATASKGGKDLQSLSVFMSENPDYSPQTSPSVIDATTVGTPAPAVEPVNPTSSISDQLAKIESQALALKDTIDQRVADEKALTEGTPAPAEGTQPPALGGTEAPPSSQRDQLLSSYIEQALGGFQLSDEAQQLQTEAAQANKLAKDLQNDMIAYAKQTRETIMEMRTNPEGKSMGAMQAGIQNYEYERYNGKDGMADMAIAAQYALNNAEYAYEIANNAVSAEREQYNSQMTAMKNIYDMLQNDMTTSEQLQYQSQLRMYENQVTSLMDSKEEAMQRAATAGAPEDVINGIRRANSTSEVWEAAGIYGEDPSLKQQREQFEMNYALNWSKFDWERQKYAQDQEIKNLLEAQAISAQEALDAQTRNDALYEGGLYLTSIQDATKNLKGLFEATGTTAIGRIAPFSGDKSRFLTSAKYLLNNETFKKLAAITENTSLGAISEGELKLVQAAATKLGGYAIYDDKGNLTGFDGAHEDVLAAVIELQDAQERYMDKIRIGALSPEEYNALGGTGNYPQPENALTRAEQIIADHKKAAAEAAGFGGAGMF